MKTFIPILNWSEFTVYTLLSLNIYFVGQKNIYKLLVFQILIKIKNIKKFVMIPGD